jgi:hypothetical protein
MYSKGPAARMLCSDFLFSITDTKNVNKNYKLYQFSETSSCNSMKFRMKFPNALNLP